jgi:SAM-dependent methyltransferase
MAAVSAGARPVTASDTNFHESAATVYERLLVPLIFEQYADDLANRVAALAPQRVLEIACGTGAVTRALASTLPETVPITATDLSQAMIDRAIGVGTSRPVEWRQADAMQLPFDDESFDAIVCQFGVMFFPDKRQAFSEMRRVLQPGGTLIFSVWDVVEENQFADVVTDAVAECFQDDPPAFLARTPHGYNDFVTIQRDLFGARLDGQCEITTLRLRARASSPENVSTAYCHGTPLRNEIEERDASRLGEVTAAAAAKVRTRFGDGVVEGRMQAHIFSVVK